MNANEILDNACNVMDQRGSERNEPNGERSMKKIVALFNQLTGSAMSEQNGWKFMICLKLVRIELGYKEDDYLDLVSYGALLGECNGKNGT